MAPIPARGMGMPSGTRRTGARHDDANSSNSPPEQTTSILPPAAAAVVAASTVSSVLPEKDSAITSVESSTNDGGS